MPSPHEHRLAPRAELRPWITGLHYVRAVAEGERCDALYLPVAEACLLVRWETDGAAVAQVIGPLSQARRKSFRAPRSYLRVALGPGHARGVLGAPLSELTDRLVPLGELWGARGAALQAALGGQGLEGAAGLVEAAIAARLRGERPRRTPVTRALARLGLGPGRVAEVARELGLSERHLRRMFQDEVGMTPKHYARIARLRRALAGGWSAPAAPWASRALDAGFHDQSHFIRECRDLLQATPEELRRSGLAEPRSGAGAGGGSVAGCRAERSRS